MAARQHRLGFRIERAEQLALPAVPHAGSHGADVGNRQDDQQLQPLEALHDGAEVENGLEVVEIAHLRGLAHQQVIADEPGNRFRFRRREAQPRAEFERDALTGDRVVFLPALGDVVQEDRDIEKPPAGDRREDGAGERMVIAELAALDGREMAHGADQMLVHRIVVIHVELHHRHDAPEGGDEAAEHARLVHQAQHDVGVVARGQQFEEDGIGLGIIPDAADAHQGLPHQLERIGVDLGAMTPGCCKQPDHVDGILAEDIRRLRHHAPALQPEGREVAEVAGRSRQQPADHAAQPRRVLHLPGLQAGAENPRQVAHVLGDEEIVLHEALDVLQPAMRLVAQTFGNVRLAVEAQPVIAALGEEMQVAAHRPQEALAFLEDREFLAQ